MTRRAVRTAALIGTLAATVGATAAALVGDLLPRPATGGVLALIGVATAYAVFWRQARQTTATVQKALADLQRVRDAVRSARPTAAFRDGYPGTPPRRSAPRT